MQLMSVESLQSCCTDPQTSTKLRHALQLIKRSLALYKPDELAFSFNGGKDSTVLLHLLGAAVQDWLKDRGQQDTPFSAGGLAGIRSFVFTHPDDFEDVHQFIQSADQQHKLDVEFLDSRDFKKGLIDFLQRTKVKAILLGTRDHDPNAADQQFFCPSSDGWPPFMRINPIFDWSYHDVWSFLLSIKAPYCRLYDQGFTSLGGKSNTVPNSALQREDGSYAPAHMLADGRLERAGRTSSYANLRDSASSPLGYTHSMGGQRSTAVLLMIGDELLAGKVADTSTNFLCQELRCIGYRVLRVVMVPDDVDSIAEEIKRWGGAADVVITCGGIGPTLDDVTVEGVAVALGRPLVRHPDFERRLRDMFGPMLTAAHLKMSEAPAGVTQLIEYPLENGETSRFPLLKCGANIFVLPGVPHLMRQKWRKVKELLIGDRPLEPFHNQVFRLSLLDETLVAQSLEAVQESAGPEVTVGSYPVSDQADGAHLLVTLDSKEVDLLRSAGQHMRSLLPPASIISEEEDVRTLDKSRSPSGALHDPGPSC